MDTPSWYAEIERDEAELDARIREQLDAEWTAAHEARANARIALRDAQRQLRNAEQRLARATKKLPRTRCQTCGLEHREVCPSGPGVADILSAPTPEPVDYSLPACER